MSERFTLVCYENPGHGGASTATYALFEMLQRRGLPVSYICLIDALDRAFYTEHWDTELGNPRNLPNVTTVFLENPTFSRQSELAALLEDESRGTIVAVGFVAAAIILAIGRPYVYISAGCDQVKRLIMAKEFPDARSVRRALELRRSVPLLSPREAEVIEHANYIITHSEDMLFFLQSLFPAEADRMHPAQVSFAEWIAWDASRFSFHAKPFDEREIDILFLASHWDRPEKNFQLLLEIVSSRPSLSAHVVGEAGKTQRTGHPIRIDGIPENAVFHGLLSDRDEVFRLMGASKTVVSPSCLDAAPGILFEGAVLGCNLVASKNCGNWQICHPELLAPDYTAPAFAECIDQSIARKFEDRLDRFLDPGGLQELERIMKEEPWKGPGS